MALFQASSLPPGYIPEPPPVPEGLTDELAEQLNALGEPTLASLGLANWTPAGFVQMFLETLHADVGLPWWGAIVASEYCWLVMDIVLMRRVWP